MDRRAVDDKVRRILTDWLGDVRIDRDGDYVVPLGSTSGFVSIYGGEGEDDPVWVRVHAPIGIGVPPSPELYRWVAVEGGQYKYGTVKLSPPGDDGAHIAVFAYSVLGEYLDPEELKNAVGMVVATADGIDEDFVARFGGRTLRSE